MSGFIYWNKVLHSRCIYTHAELAKFKYIYKAFKDLNRNNCLMKRVMGSRR